MNFDELLGQSCAFTTFFKSSMQRSTSTYSQSHQRAAVDFPNGASRNMDVNVVAMRLVYGGQKNASKTEAV